MHEIKTSSRRDQIHVKIFNISKEGIAFII
jgi:hypothetical protein